MAVHLTNGRVLEYDQLIIATGVTPRPDQTPGLDDSDEWQKSVFDFYTYEGTTALAKKLATWEGGRLAISIVDMPIKCPVAPLEFAFLADSFFTDKHMRDRVEIVYVTPLPGAFTKPIASKRFGGMLDDRKITLEPDFMLERVDADRRTLVSYDEREIEYDLLVTVPLNMGAEFVARSGLGNELNLVPVDKHTLLSKKHSTIFALGDANDIPASKAGSVAHFEIDVFIDNFLEHIADKPMTGSFDGHANCFIETGHGKAMLIDFNYETEPLPGKYPVPGVGPMSLLKETKVNHMGKLAFRWAYWNVLLPGRPMPLAADMSMAGKEKVGV
jgi:sulfide:quinone oxidoreductase